jgi:uncharacterized membrane protein YfcA
MLPIDTQTFYILILLTGCVAGFLAGLLGIGGGLVIVPALAWLLSSVSHDPASIMHVALGTSLASIVFTSISSVNAHHRHGAVLWPVMRRMSVGIMLGAVAGAILVDQLNTAILQMIFGVFALLVSLQMATAWRVNSHSDLPNIEHLSLAGVVIGIVSSCVGIGGGTMSVPYLMWHGVDIRRAVATAAANGLPIAVAGAGGYMVTGYITVGWQNWQLGYVNLPMLVALVCGSVILAPVGAKVAHRIDTRRLRQIFALLLAIIGMRMILITWV